MIVSRKQQPSAPAAPLHINNLAIEKVAFFKYLGVWLSHKLTWNKHVEVCKVASKQLGVIYRKFYWHSSSETLLQLYMSFIWPCFEYAAPVWDHNLQTLVYDVEKVQRFASKMCLKDWSCTYRDLLYLSELPTLQLRRTFLKLCYLYKIMNGFFIYPNAPLVSRQIRPLRNSSCHLLERLPSRTNASYFPHTISLWNNLPSSLHNCSSLVSFEHHLLTHLMW